LPLGRKGNNLGDYPAPQRTAKAVDLTQKGRWATLTG